VEYPFKGMDMISNDTQDGCVV